MVLFDANFLILFLDPQIRKRAGPDPRIAHLVANIQKSKDRIVVPTPALSELLVGAGDAAPAYLDIISRSRFFRIEPFGIRAAAEAAEITRTAIAKGNKSGSAIESSWGKIKFDRQIIAIAKVVGATHIYSEDGDLARHARDVGIPVIGLDDLAYPPVLPQIEMALDPIEAIEQSDGDD